MIDSRCSCRVKGFIETSFVDWPGRIAAVVFLPGCNYRCGWCHNRELVEHPGTLPDIPIDTVITRMNDLHDWVDGVVITGGEPTVCPDLMAIVQRFSMAGIPMKLDTNGSRPDVLEQLLELDLLDGISMDIKAPFDPDHYSRAVGVSADVNAVKRSIRLILRNNLWCEFRTTVVPGLHTPEDIDAIRTWLAKESTANQKMRPLKLQAFKPAPHLPEPYRSMPAMDLEGWNSQYPTSNDLT